MYLHTPVKTGVSFFAPDKRWKKDEKQKNRHSDGSFALREKVYEEMQDKSVSLKTDCLCSYNITFAEKSLSKDRRAQDLFF